MFKYLILMLMGLGSGMALADCSDVQVDAARLGAIRNQGVSGLCFAYQAADLISYKFGQRVSALDLAIHYLRATHGHGLRSVYKGGGDESPALETGKQIGFCDESDLPSEEDKVDVNNMPLTKIYGSLKKLEEKDWQNRNAFSLAKNIFPLITRSDFEEALQQSSERHRIFFLQERTCHHRYQFNQFEFTSLEVGKDHSSAQVIERLDQQLELKNLVGLDFNSRDIYLPLRKPIDHLDPEFVHAVTITGRRWNMNKGTCQYEIRDNFGSQCEVYQEGYDCHEGYLWVDRQFLEKNMLGIGFL